MNNILKLLSAVMLTVSALSCIEEDSSDPQITGRQLQFSASFEEQTKTVLTPDFQVRWKATDIISVSGGTDSVPFSIESMKDDGRSAVFSGVIQEAATYRCIYPYQDNLIWSDGTVNAVLPSVQQASAGSFADGASLAVAEISGTGMAFRNVGAILGFKINDDGISAVRLTSADGTALAGKVEITVGQEPVVKVCSGSASVVLEGPFQKGQTYYMTVLPGAHEKGFSLQFINSNGQTVDYNASKALTLKRNSNVLFADFKIEKPWQSHYLRVKEAGKLKDGDIVRIACPVQNAAAGVYDKNYLSKVEAVFAGEEMTAPDAMDLKLSQSGNLWKLMSGKNVLGTTGAKKMTLLPASQSDAQGQEGPNMLWSIDIDAEGLATLTSGQHGRILYNVNSPRFLNYTSASNAAMLLPQLYRKALCPEDLQGETAGGVLPDPSPEPQPEPQPEASLPALGQTDWLEMPGKYLTEEVRMHCYTHYASMDGRDQRNYTFLYDKEMYTSYWVAYPLCSAHMGKGRNESWQYDPSLPSEYQTSVKKGYKLPLSTPNYSNNSYARGHQIPNADRSGVSGMQAQTYYSTNMTPQIQNGFNGDVWADLEMAARGAVHSDTLYMVTGATFNKVGGKETVKYVKNGNDGKMLPVPNWYWKVMLKVTRGSDGKVKDARTAAFWFPHDELFQAEYMSYVTTVDQVEAWTGFDFFVNLPQELQTVAETQKDWTAFKNF